MFETNACIAGFINRPSSFFAHEDIRSYHYPGVMERVNNIGIRSTWESELFKMRDLGQFHTLGENTGLLAFNDNRPLEPQQLAKHKYILDGNAIQ